MTAESVLDADELERFKRLRPLRDKRRNEFFDSEEWRAFGFSNKSAAGYWLVRVRGDPAEYRELPFLACGEICQKARRRPHDESLWRW